MKGLNLALAISLVLVTTTVMADNTSTTTDQNNLNCTMHAKGKLDADKKAQLKDFTDNTLPEFLQKNCGDCKSVNIACKPKKQAKQNSKVNPPRAGSMFYIFAYFQPAH